MALFFCFIPFSKVGADTSSGSIPGIDLPDQNTLDDLNNSADDEQNAVFSLQVLLLHKEHNHDPHHN